MNKLILMGRLTKEPTIKYNGDKPIARFNIAVDRRYKDSNGNYPTDFFNMVSFNNTASFVEKYLHKGTKVIVEGEIWNNNYEKDGKTIYQDQYIANNVEFAESKKAAEENVVSETTNDGFNQVSEDVNENQLPFV
jgi:single-strand DNA-binding protein